MEWQACTTPEAPVCPRARRQSALGGPRAVASSSRTPLGGGRSGHSRGHHPTAVPTTRLVDDKGATEDERQKADDIISLLTPVIKGYLTDKGFEDLCWTLP